MTKLAKIAIKQSFLELLEEKPLNKISVSEITARCNLNRNTFYYHYRDISALVEDILLEQTDRILVQYPSLSSLEDCLYAMLDFVYDNRRSIFHIYQSLSRSVCEKYIWKACHRLVMNYWKDAPSRKRLTREEAEAAIDFHVCVCFGLAIHWLNSGTSKNDTKKRIHLLGKTLKMPKF